MTGGQIGIVIGAVGTLITGLYGTYRLARADRLKAGTDNSAVLLAGWRDLQASITAEVERVKKSYIEEIERLKTEHEADRQAWRKERIEMQEQIETLQAQVYALMNRPATVRTRSEDRKPK